MSPTAIPPTRRGLPSRSLRGFSLLEALIGVAIIGVVAALAVPALKPQVDAARLEAATDGVASLLSRAQAEAMATRRCVRVILEDARTLVAERLNGFDCDHEPHTAPRLDGGTRTWIEVARYRIEADAVALAFDPAPSESTAAAFAAMSPAHVFDPGAVAEPDQIRFRPSGRVWGVDQDYTDDDGVITVSTTAVIGGPQEKRVVVEGSGVVCTLKRGELPVVSGTKRSCR